MCWITRKKLEPKIAEEDIPIIKIVENYNSKYYCPYFYRGITYYELNKPSIKVILKPYSTSKFTSISEGYHSYSRDVKISLKSSLVFSDILCNNTKYYLVNNSKNKLCVVEGIIPKGTKYFLNENNEYVSEQIILKNVLDVI